jgi:hypothetical protein
MSNSRSDVHTAIRYLTKGLHPEISEELGRDKEARSLRELKIQQRVLLELAFSRGF